MYKLLLFVMCFCVSFSAFTGEYKAIIFDMGNVLIPSKQDDITNELSEHYNIDREEVSAYLGGPGRQDKRALMRADIDFAEFWSRLSSHLNIDPDPEKGEKFWYHTCLTWIEQQRYHIEIYQQVFADLKKQGVVLGVLSNTNKPTLEAARDFGLFKHFEEDMLIFSCQVNLSKPENGIFTELTKRLYKRNIKPNECLLVDNKTDNIIVAKYKGFKTYRFNSEMAWKDNQEDFLVWLK
jgi:FMN phosphatase YigB (HAD superfamily)